ncbi:enoyl-ACP reductase [Candidatus Magnetominusculus xianensis]|uniref:Enoyl-ACP reductase n=2 Tax=Candidatus Magnetominusculus xianensis TaxID=1748249 RepID=A0ABR5SH58_9BACT|nr:enoyl-ACP reductase [Candidatus Magnetominusculus xianensis]
MLKFLSGLNDMDTQNTDTPDITSNGGPICPRKVLVTGSSRGIGAAIALAFAKSGADVAINFSKQGGRSEEHAKNLAAEIESMGQKAILVPGDISQKDSVKKIFADAASALGGLDVLVLNAARAPFKPIERLLERELRALVDTNYIGNIFCVQEALPYLTSTTGHDKHIIFISSLGSRFYNQSYPLGSMKAAMEAVVRDLSETLKNIAVNAVSGGLVKTDSFKVLRQFIDGIERIPEKLFVMPEEIADVVLFLCSPASRGIRGQTIVVDRGLSNCLHRNA